MPTPELQAAIEGLYEAFHQYPLKPSVAACPCCHSPEDERPLHSKPLHQLTEKDLFGYAMSAELTWGDADDFRHFLPRIFELALRSENYSFADREIIFAKLCHGEWRSWPEPEQKGVERFLHAVWRAVILTPPTDEVCCADVLESWLCAIAQAEDDLTPYLQMWLESSDAVATWNLALAITRTALARGGRQGLNAFWEHRVFVRLQVYEWLRSDVVRKKLEAGIDLFGENVFANELMDALVMIS